MSKLKILSRDDINKVVDIPRELVEVPEWGGAVYVRGLTAMERSELENEMFGFGDKKIAVTKDHKKKGQNDTDIEMRLDMKLMRVRLSAMCMVGEDGKRLYSDEQVDELGAKSVAALDRIYKVAQRLAGFTSDDMEELEGNSAATPPADSASD